MTSDPQPIQRLDWRAYFMEFQRVHGGNPIKWKGLLLYQDGYRYSDKNYAGPEYAPKDEQEARELGVVYWTERKHIVDMQVHKLRQQIMYLLQEQATRSAPLQEIKMYVEDGHLRQESGDIDIDQMQMRLTWLEEDLEACDEKLRELANERTPQPQL